MKVACPYDLMMADLVQSKRLKLHGDFEGKITQITGIRWWLIKGCLSGTN